jgi:heme-degrading monooxygenase HmoA
MIYEVAYLSVLEGEEAKFEAAVGEAVPLFIRAKGCHGLRLARVVETPGRYRLEVGWDTLEDHTEGFRNSADFAEWRRLVGGSFAAPPLVEHDVVVLSAPADPGDPEP